jgi:hypothetical protein
MDRRHQPAMTNPAPTKLMAKQFALLFILRDAPKDLLLQVRGRTSDHLLDYLATRLQVSGPEFYEVETLEGNTVLVNLACVQGARFLWDAAEAPPDHLRGDEKIKIQFKGRPVPFEERTEDPDTVFHLFLNVQHDPMTAAEFTDEDDEVFSPHPHELVWISAPTHLLRQGERLASSEGRSAEDERQ